MTKGSPIRIGRVARPHGVRGAVVVTLDNPESESLFGVAYVHLGDGVAATRYEVLQTRPGRRGQLILSLQGITTPEAVDALRGREVLLEEKQLPRLEEGEYWFRDLIGLQAVDPAGAPLGEVGEVVDTADVPVLVIRSGKTERFVPFAEPFLLEVDLPQRRIVVEALEEVEA